MVRAPGWSGLCEVCQRWGSGRLCNDCVARFAAPATRCARCGLRTGLALGRCGECLRDPPPFQATCCAVDYGFPWDGVIARFKFRGQVELADALAGLMLGQPAGGPQAPELQPALLPMPLAPRRLAERGYNQAWELARRLGRARCQPARADVLERVLDTPAQAELGRAGRQRNLRAAFMVAPAQRDWLQGRDVCLVDDVMTTGASAREAASCLLRAGAARVDVWVLARTPALAPDH
jgi:ComF family protein